MTVLVNHLQKPDDCYSIEILEDASVKELKYLIQLQTKIPELDQTLFLDEDELEDDNQKLADVGIKNNSEVTLSYTYYDEDGM